MSYPFHATGKTIAFTADTTAPTGVQAASTDGLTNPGSRDNQYRIHNAGAGTVFVAWGLTAATATSNAVIPTGTGSNSKQSYPLAAGATEVFSGPFNAYWSGITASGTGVIYVTPGRGF